MWLIFLNCLFMSSSLAVKTAPSEDFYHAAVIEYSPVMGADGNDTVNKNAIEFVRLIEEAAKFADIIVFPEAALNYEDISFFIEIPYGNNTVAPADNSSLHPVLRMLSKAARDKQVYISFNVHERDDTSSNETLRYNTNVVFDRKGVIVAKYRKYNLYGEQYLNITKVPEVSYFDSDFGVRFGMFICFDILFKDPALQLVHDHNITDIIYPSWWSSELPAFLSVQMQFAWSYMTDTNLLSSGLNSIPHGSSGSGIYAGKKGPVVYIFSEKNETRILTAKLFKKGKRGHSEGQILEPSTPGTDIAERYIWFDDLQFYETFMLTPPIGNDFFVVTNSPNQSPKEELMLSQTLNKTICQGSLCCEFSINMTLTYRPVHFLNMSDISYIRNDSYYHYQYRIGVFNGIRGYNAGYTAGIQVCAIIACLNDSLSGCEQKTGNTIPLKFNTDRYGEIFLSSTTFTDVSIKAVSNEKTDFTFPDILESSNSSSLKAFGSLPDVSKISFTSDSYSSKLRFSSDKLIFGSVYSRIVSRDGGSIGVSSANILLTNSLILILTSLLLLLYLSHK